MVGAVLPSIAPTPDHLTAANVTGTVSFELSLAVLPRVPSDLAYGDDGVTVARVHLMVRANDPLYEASFKIYTSRLEDKIWTHTLTQLAAHFGSEEPVSMEVNLVDKRRQWNQIGNIWKNSAVRTLLRQDRRG